MAGASLRECWHLREWGVQRRGSERLVGGDITLLGERREKKLKKKKNHVFGDQRRSALWRKGGWREGGERRGGVRKKESVCVCV